MVRPIRPRRFEREGKVHKALSERKKRGTMEVMRRAKRVLLSITCAI